MSDHPSTRRPGTHLHAVPPPSELDGADGTLPPPHDPQAEQAVLGSLLIQPTLIDEVIDLVTAPEFYRPAHELIYQAITTVHLTGDPVDAITVADHLHTTGNLARAGGRAYLHQLIDGVSVAANAPHYADIVADAAARRRLVEAGTRITALGYQAGADVDDALAAAADHIANIPRPTTHGAAVNTWAPVDFAAVLDGDLSAPIATVLTRRDGKKLLYPYAVHSISGEPGSLKTWVALLAIAQELDAGNNAALIDFEDRAQSVAARLLQIGVDPHTLRDPNRFRYVRPDTAIDTTGAAHLDHAVADCTIAVIDGVTEAMSMHGWSINDNDDVAAYVMKLPRRIADRGPAVLQIDHVTKDSETRGRYAIGGQHKLASITGTAMKAIKVRSGGRGEHGVIKVVLDKDKHGDVGPDGHTIGEFHLDDTNPGRTYAWLDHPTASVDENGHFRPTTLMKRVSDMLLATPRAVSMREIRASVKGNNESIAQAVDALVREGYIRLEEGPRGAVMHHLITAFEDPS